MLTATACVAGRPNHFTELHTKLLLLTVSDCLCADHRATAVFRLGSKLAHTCGIANTEYKTYNGKGYHIAVRAIEAGELLTTSYSGSRERLMSTAMRWVTPGTANTV